MEVPFPPSSSFLVFVPWDFNVLFNPQDPNNLGMNIPSGAQRPLVSWEGAPVPALSCP